METRAGTKPAVGFSNRLLDSARLEKKEKKKYPALFEGRFRLYQRRFLLVLKELFYCIFQAQQNESYAIADLLDVIPNLRPPEAARSRSEASVRSRGCCRGRPRRSRRRYGDPRIARIVYKLLLKFIEFGPVQKSADS